MTTTRFCNTFYSRGWLVYCDGDTIYVSLGRTCFILEKDASDNWYFDGTDVEISEIKSVAVWREGFVLYFHNGNTATVWSRPYADSPVGIPAAAGAAVHAG